MSQTVTDSDLSVLESLDEDLVCDFLNCKDQATHRVETSCSCVRLLCRPHTRRALDIAATHGRGVCRYCKAVSELVSITSII